MPFCVHYPWPRLKPSVRSFPLPIGLQIRPFISTAHWLAEGREPTYYELLNVPITATTQEIKKQFYALSLAHHPDKNPKDPNASARFASISNAYHVLSNTAKRAKYDHDHDIHRAAAVSSSSTRSGHRGSYVGSRPPSGLSKRRGPFRGPPPSFYAHGGYGDSQNRPHQHSHHNSHTHQEPQHRTNTSDSDPSAFIHSNAVPHFDASSHFRTQSHEDIRRRERRRRAYERAKAEAAERGFGISDGEENMTGRFFMVAGVLGAAFAIAFVGRTFVDGLSSKRPIPAPVKQVLKTEREQMMATREARPRELQQRRNAQEESTKTDIVLSHKPES